MNNVSFGQICELSYLQETGPCLPHLVRDLAEKLLRLGLADVQITWDCDDIAMFDIPGHRIILASAHHPFAGIACKLLISVGPSPLHLSDRPIRLSHAALCRRIVRGLEQKYAADGRQMRSFPGVLSPDRVDDILYATGSATQFDTGFRKAAPRRPASVNADDTRLRAAITKVKLRGQNKVMAIGLLINGLTWSMASAAPVLVLAVFGSNLIGTLVWASTSQLPR